MRKLLWCAGFVGLGLLVGAAALHAAPEEGKNPGHGPGRGLIARMIQAQFGRVTTLRAELNLSDEQRQAICQTLESHRADIAGAIKPVVAAKRKLRDAVLAEKPDDAAIRTAADAVGKSVGDAAVTFAKIKVELMDKAQLTPQQIEKIAEFKADTDASVDEFIEEAGKAQ
jgi:Spy/CpxP family protein refolding chaperone